MFTFSLRAQELPSLPKASDVVTGTLPNGIDYYLVKNGVSSGFADFALVQKGLVSESLSRSALTNLQHFQNKSPYQYLAKLGVGYGKKGYIRTEGTSTVYDFENVPVAQSSVRDTVLLMLFDISELSPHRQAVIIAGDIDPAAIKQRMDVFSMMVTPRNGQGNAGIVAWDPERRTGFSMELMRSRTEATVGMGFLAPRTPASSMNSVQPLVSEMFSRELGYIAKARLEQAFKNEGIPFVDAYSDFSGSADSPDPEKTSFGLTVRIEDVERSAELLGSVLADLKEDKVDVAEFQSAKDRQLSDVGAAASEFKNSDWVRKCTSAYLYGSDLASPAAVKTFFQNRNMDAAREAALFNDFKSAVLSGPKDMVFRHFNPLLPYFDIASDVLLPAFERGWSQSVKGPSSVVFMVNQSDTLSIAMPKSKVKLKNSATEPISGGELWTFSNGMKVVFKKSGSDHRFEYGFLLNGGLSEVKDLKQGEEGYISEMLKLNTVSGFTSRGFYDVLRANGLSMEPEVTATHFALRGSAPSSSFHLLLKSLVALAGSRHIDREGYDWYRECEKLRLSLERKSDAGVSAALDSIMCPGSVLGSLRNEKGLSDDLPDRAGKYFDARFSRCNDGVFVIVGDIDPNFLKRELLNYLGNFHTSSSFALRPQTGVNLKSGWTTVTERAERVPVGDGRPGLYLAMSAQRSFSAEKYMAFKVAVAELGRRMAEALADTGMYAHIEDGFEFYPTERLSVKMFCRPVEVDGLPAGLEVQDARSVMTAVRTALSELSSADVPAAALSAAKNALLSEMSTKLSKPEGVVEAVMMRYSVGKDLVSDYKSKVNAVKASDVKDMLSALAEGAKVEFVYY